MIQGIPGIMPSSIVADGGLERVKRVADPDRMRRLDAYERLYKGLAYAGRPSFWDQSVPLHERAPCVHSGLPEAAGRRLSALVFGARQFPQITAEKGAPNAEQVTAAVRAIVRASSLPLTLRKALIQGLSVGTWCLILGLRNGRPVATIQSAKLCTPTLDDDGRVLSLDVRYRYQGQRDGKPCTLWYRRTIDAQKDVVYQPVEALESGRDPEWTEDVQSSVAHNLGFCPVVWHRHDADPSDTDDLDGTPLFAGMEDELEALDFALSQRHRNGRYNGEPQVVVTGAGQGSMQAAAGRTARVAGPAQGPERGGSDERFSWFNSLFGRRGGEAASQKAPNKVWFIEEPGASATMLESSGAGARVLSEDAEGLRRAILEARSIVIASPEQVGANASAALMESLHAPMVDHADTLRTEYEPVVIEVVSMLLRICARSPVGSVSLPEVEAARAALLSAPLSLAWGRYYEPTLTDISQAVSAASVASGGAPLLSRRTAVRWIAQMIDVDDIDTEVDDVLGETSADAAVLDALPTDEPQPVSTAAPTAGADTVADTALNGAQITSALDMLEKAALGSVPIESVEALLRASFPGTRPELIEAMIAPIRRARAATAPQPAQPAIPPVTE